MKPFLPSLIAISIASFSLDLSSQDFSLQDLISTIEGARIIAEKNKQYMKKTVLVGFESSGYTGKEISGSVKSVTYDIPPRLLEEDVVLQYQTAFENNGFINVTTCSGVQCGSVASMSNALNIEAPLGYDENQEFRVLRINNTVFATIYATGYPSKRTLNIQLVQQAKNKSTVSLNKHYISNLINQHGKFDIPNLHFKFDSDKLLPSSNSSIKELALYLKTVPSQHFYLVGHTDDTGNAEYNQVLSQKRALAIQSKLVELGIKKDKLAAIGVGEFSPSASNDNEAGKIKNRRVELVKRSDLL